MDHLTQEQVEGYHTRSLRGAELLRVSDHMIHCEACRSRVLEGGDLSGAEAFYAHLTSEVGAGTHLTYDEIAGYVDGQLGHAEASMVELHTGECSACAADLREIRDLRRAIDAGRLEVMRPSRLFGSRLPALGWRSAFAFAAAAACAALVAVAIHQHPANPTSKMQPPQQANSRDAAAPSAGVTARLLDGSRVIALTADGALTGLDGLSDRYRNPVAEALTTQRVRTPASVEERSPGSGVLLGPPTARAAVDLLEPIGLVVEAQRPVFRWTSVPGAEYRVAIYDSEFQQAGGSDWIQGAQWQSLHPLRRGARYSWQLTVRHDGAEFNVPVPPATEARFQVLDAAGEAELTGLKNAWGDSHLVMGLAYARAGLLNEAKRQFQALADQNPGAPAAAALLSSLNRPAVSSGRRQSQ